jgi:hypothetical protein
MHQRTQHATSPNQEQADGTKCSRAALAQDSPTFSIRINRHKVLVTRSGPAVDTLHWHRWQPRHGDSAARPSAVSFVAIGSVRPFPTVVKRALFTPRLAQIVRGRICSTLRQSEVVLGRADAVRMTDDHQIGVRDNSGGFLQDAEGSDARYPDNSALSKAKEERAIKRYRDTFTNTVHPGPVQLLPPTLALAGPSGGRSRPRLFRPPLRR